ncbi:MAG: hypothetical protein WCF17_22760 [Terracidiphilus sp.]
MEMRAVAMSAKTMGADQSTAQPSLRLIAAAHEFEGQMLKELLKPMTESDGLGGSDPGAETLGEFGSEALGKALSEQGGFGIANQIIAQLSRSGNRSDTESVTRNGHLNTTMSRLK